MGHFGNTVEILSEKYFCFSSVNQHFTNKPSRLCMNRWMKVQTLRIYAFFGVKMRIFGEISIWSAASIHFFTFFRNFYLNHWIFEVGIASMAFGEDTLLDKRSRLIPTFSVCAYIRTLGLMELQTLALWSIEVQNWSSWVIFTFEIFAQQSTILQYIEISLDWGAGHRCKWLWVPNSKQSLRWDL
jgi:hypothetical protein